MPLTRPLKGTQFERFVARAFIVNTGGESLTRVVWSVAGQPVVVFVAVRVYVPSFTLLTILLMPELPSELTGCPAAPVGAHV